MLPSLEIARAHIRALEHDAEHKAERARIRAAAPARRRMRDFMRRSH